MNKQNKLRKMENSSENKQTESFYHYRGVTKCLSAGISFVTDNFLHLLKLTLPVALLYAVFMSGLVYFISDSRVVDLLINVGVTAAAQSPMIGDFAQSVMIQYGLGLILCSVCSMVMYYLFMGLIYRNIVIYSHDFPLKKYGMLPTYKISAKYGMKYFCYSVVIAFIGFVLVLISLSPLFIPTEGVIFGYMKVVFAAILFIVVVIGFAVPINLSIPALFLEKGTAAKAAISGFKKGMKMWSKSFCLSLLIALLCGTVMFVLSLPSLVMINGYYAATFSQMSGDAVSFPSGFHFWYFVVLLITGYLYTFTFWIQSVPFAYLYASAKSDEKNYSNIGEYN